VAPAPLKKVVALVPPTWFGWDGGDTYVEYLVRRLQNAAFAAEAEDARAGT
jgi:hypothetical protein